VVVGVGGICHLEVLMQYLYRCQEHGIIERHFPLGKAPDKVVCPQCGRAARRAYTVPGVVYKGSGWASKDGGKDRLWRDVE